MSCLRTLLFVGAALLLAGFAPLAAQGGAQSARADVPLRFVTLDVVVDPVGATLAAWQVRVEDPSGRAKLVGVEGGEDPSFAAPPAHDPRALAGGVVVLAAFDETDAGPRSATRVARLSFAVEGATDPDFTVTAEVVASPDGPIEGATVRLER